MHPLAQPWSELLALGPSVEVLLQQLAEPPDGGRLQGIACLWGAWFDGQAVVTHSPMRWLLPGEDPIEASGDLPSLASDAAHGAQVGGGWIGALPFVPGQGVLGFYDHLIRHDPHLGWVFETLGLPGREQAVKEELVRWRALLAAAGARDPLLPGFSPPTGCAAPTGESWSVGPFSSVVPDSRVRDDYLAGVEAAVGQIHRGDYYQLNLCTRLTASFAGDPLALFAEAAATLRPVFGGFVSDGRRTVVSFSPELFLRSRNGRVTTSPIKGTAPRLPGETHSPLLEASAKDAAENIMITDLMRNDLSRVCRPGTVMVEDLLDLQAHPGVWHLVSTVRGQLNDGVGVTDLLRATFPPGSVTGAPKEAALDGIAALEPVGRGAYTGAFGMISALAGVELNVLIRSFELEGDRIELGVGGGITVDSVPMAEWRECVHKAAPLITTLGSTLVPTLRPESAEPLPEQLAGGVFETLLVKDGTVLRLADHLARLDRSCRELYRTGTPETLSRDVRTEALRHPSVGRRAIRVQALPQATGDLTFQVSSREIGPRLRSSEVEPSTRPGRLWRHKWQDRRVLNDAEAATAAAMSRPGEAFPLFVAGDGTVLETTRGNVFAVSERELLTPPLRDDLLPGVTRRAVMDVAPELGLAVRLAPFTVSFLQESAAVFWTSSLSGAVAVDRCGGVEIGQRPDLLAELNARLGF